MAIVDILRKPFSLLIAMFQAGAVTNAEARLHAAPPQADSPSLAATMAGLRQDDVLRARFAADPRGVLRDAGIDPSLYRVPDRLDEEALARFLQTWTGPIGPEPKPDILPILAAETPTAPFSHVMTPAYGPAAGPSPREVREPPRRDRPDDPPVPDRQEPPLPSPPAPVYGPPPGLR